MNSLIEREEASKQKCVQRFLLRLMKFKYAIEYVPGYIAIGTEAADTLSRSPVEEETGEERELQTDLGSCLDQIMSELPATKRTLAGESVV